MTIPGHVCWVVHRVATGGHYRDSLHTILTCWTLGDLMDAAEISDALDDARERAARERS